ncbi:MAG: zinc ribbon domain-containing protein [Methanobacterium sp.]|nr:zinc ribbon domain-containing protein [Methanobacterium sp.]
MSNMGYKESGLRKRCPKCGTINSYNARFCHKCGEDLDKHPESKTTVTILDRGGWLFW